MKKVFIIIAVFILSVFLVSCEDPNKDLKTLYTYSLNSNIDLEKVDAMISQSQTTIFIRINLKSDFNSDEIKNMVNDEMTHEEINTLIRNMREKSKEYYLFLNENFIKKHELNIFGNNLYISQYSPTITIKTETKEESLALFENLVHLVELEEVVSVDLLNE